MTLTRTVRLFLFDRPFGVDFAGESLPIGGRIAQRSPRECVNSPVWQGEDEEVAYEVNFFNWGVPLANTEEVLLLDKKENDITTAHIVGSPFLMETYVMIGGRVIGLQRKQQYKMLFIAEFDDGNKYSAYCRIYGER